MKEQNLGFFSSDNYIRFEGDEDVDEEIDGILLFMEVITKK